MLTADGCVTRRNRLWKLVGDSCDLIVLAQPESVNHQSGFFASPFEFRSNEGAGILILSPGHSMLATDATLHAAAEQAHVDERVAPTWYDGRHSAPHRLTMLAHTAIKAIGPLPGNRIGIEAGSMPAGIAEHLRESRPGLELVDVSQWVRAARRPKDPDEISILARSLQASDAAAAALREPLPTDITELDIYRLMLDRATTAAGEPIRLYGDFVSAPGRTRRGGPPTNRRIEPGDLLLVDYSVVIRGYRGDVASTVLLSGDLDPRLEEHFEACLAALHAGESMLRAGVFARDVDAAVRSALEARGLDRYFTSHSGHGLGLGHPEPPYIVRDSTETLEIGDVVSLEPSQFVPGLDGMRVEHNYLITPEGYDQISKHDLRLC